MRFRGGPMGLWKQGKNTDIGALRTCGADGPKNTAFCPYSSRRKRKPSTVAHAQLLYGEKRSRGKELRSAYAYLNHESRCSGGVRSGALAANQARDRGR